MTTSSGYVSRPFWFEDKVQIEVRIKDHWSPKVRSVSFSGRVLTNMYAERSDGALWPLDLPVADAQDTVHLVSRKARR